MRSTKRAKRPKHYEARERKAPRDLKKNRLKKAVFSLKKHLTNPEQCAIINTEREREVMKNVCG